MRKEQLDDSLKNKLDSYESNVPEHIWEGVASRLDQSKEIKPAFWMLHRGKVIGAAAGLLLGAVVLGSLYDTETTELKDVTNVDHSSVQETMILDESLLIQSNDVVEQKVEVEELVLSTINTQLPRVSEGNTESLIDEAQERSSSMALVSDELKDNEESSVAISSNTTYAGSKNGLYSISSIPSIKQNLNSPRILFNKDQQCADFRETRNNLYWSLAYAQDFPIRNIEAVDRNLSDYVSLREESEVFQSAFSVNMNLGLAFRNGLNLRTGLIYSRLSENFSHDILSGTEIVTIQEIDEEGTVISSTTDTSFIYTSFTNTNLYETLDVPVLVGFEKSNEKFGMGFYTGLLVNMVFNKTGSVISPVDDNAIIGLTDRGDSGAYFNRNLGISYYASTIVTYKLTNRLQLKMEPYFRYSPKSLSNINYLVNQSYYLFGGQVGLRYNL